MLVGEPCPALVEPVATLENPDSKVRPPDTIEYIVLSDREFRDRRRIE